MLRRSTRNPTSDQARLEQAVQEAHDLEARTKEERRQRKAERQAVLGHMAADIPPIDPAVEAEARRQFERPLSSMSDLTDFGEEVNIHELYNAASQYMNTLQ